METHAVPERAFFCDYDAASGGTSRGCDSIIFGRGIYGGSYSVPDVDLGGGTHGRAEAEAEEDEERR